MDSIKRNACRAVLLTPDNEVLLIKIASVLDGWSGWITPGGGIDLGESEEQALRRELNEEVGLKDFVIEGKLWVRSHAFPWNGKFYEQEEVFFLIRTSKFELGARELLTENEKREIKEFRWWRLEDIETSDEEFAPRQLTSYIKEILQNGIPKSPHLIGI